MAAFLNPRAIFVAAMILSWVLAAIVEMRATPLRRSGSLPDVVTLGLIGQGLGFGLFSQRDAISDLLSVYVANLLIIWAISALYLGVENRRGSEGSLAVALLLPAAIALLYPLIGLSDQYVVERVAVQAIVACTGYVIVVVSALGALRPGRRLGPLVIVTALLAVTFAQVERAATMIDQRRGDLFAPQPAQTLFAMIILVGFFVTVVGYILMLAPHEASRAEAEAPA